MDWKLILEEKPPVARVLVLYDPDADDFCLVMWDGGRFVGYGNHETYEKYSLFWTELKAPDGYEG